MSSAHDNHTALTPDEQSKQLSALQWLAIALGVAVAVSLCITAGRWQWHRHEARDAVIHTIVANYESDPEPLEQLVPTISSTLPDSEVWARATVTGHYLPQYSALLRNRPIESTPSVHVLVPFVTDAGNTMLVNRGWVPFDTNVDRPSVLPEPPEGTVEITVHLRKTEPATDRKAPVGQVQAINIAAAIATGLEYGGGTAVDLPNVYENVYGSLDSESPAATDPINRLPKPSTDPKSHLSYAFQWWVFAIGAATGFVVLIVREIRRKNGTSKDQSNPFAQLNRIENTEHDNSQDGAGTSQETGQGNELSPTGPTPQRAGLRKKTKREQSEEDYEDSLFE